MALKKWEKQENEKKKFRLDIIHWKTRISIRKKLPGGAGNAS